MKNHIYYVYILLCADDSYYVGVTNDLHRRVEEHQTGSQEDTHYTDSRRPVRLVHFEPCKYIENAIKREKQLKTWSRAKKQALIAGNIKKLKELSRCKNSSQHANFERDRGLVF